MPNNNQPTQEICYPILAAERIGQKVCFFCDKESEEGKWVPIHNFYNEFLKKRLAYDIKWKCEGGKVCLAAFEKKKKRLKLLEQKENNKKLKEQAQRQEKKIRKIQHKQKKLSNEVNELKTRTDNLEKITKKINKEPFLKVFAIMVREKWKIKYLTQGEKWWIALRGWEKEKIKKSKTLQELNEVWQKANDRRNFWTLSFFLVFFSLIFFGWNKFWTWYEKPVKQEWDWDEEKEEENGEKEQEKAEPVEPKPKPKTKWKRIKNYLLNNKVKTLCLLGIIICLIVLIWQGWNLYRA